MAGESDQTKWVGIRPVDPAENIPVTESAPLDSIKVEPKTAGTIFKTTEQTPLTDILVAPSAGSPEFLVSTVKRTPAIADLQALADLVRLKTVITNAGAGTYVCELYTVPADYIFELCFLRVASAQADPTIVEFILRSEGTDYTWYSAAYGGAWSVLKQTLKIIYDEDEIVRVTWQGCLAATDLYHWMFGNLIKKY